MFSRSPLPPRSCAQSQLFISPRPKFLANRPKHPPRRPLRPIKTSSTGWAECVSGDPAMQTNLRSNAHGRLADLLIRKVRAAEQPKKPFAPVRVHGRSYDSA